MKKLLILLITGVLSTSLLAGCVSDSSKSSASSTAGSSMASSSSTTGSSMMSSSTSSSTDAVASASPKESSDPATIAKGLSKDGYWIFAILGDVTLKDDLTVDGEFHDKDDASKKIFRKLALYAQDKDHNITAKYTLTVPKIVVDSPGFSIQNGTVKGDVYVNAEGFELKGATVEGNLYFKTQELKDKALLDTGKVTGETAVK